LSREVEVRKSLYNGPTIPDVAAMLKKRPQCAYGGVTIAERHVKKGRA
jgi:hypothetical protein